MWIFDHLKVTAEDRQRTQLYRDNVARERLKAEAPSFTDFIHNLQLEIYIDEMLEADITRVAQLTQRTNQFNSTTIRRNEQDIRVLQNKEDYLILTVTPKDRFGNYGLSGLVILECKQDCLIVDSFILSCRILGKGIEHHLLAKIGEIAKQKGLTDVYILFRPSSKNIPVFKLLEEIKHDDKIPHQDGFSFKYNADFLTKVSFANTIAATKKNLSMEIVAPTTGKPSANLLSLCEKMLHYSDMSVLTALVKKRGNVSSKRIKHNYIEPSTHLQKQLAVLWSEVLKIDRIGIDDDFFAIGGTSLQAIQVIAAMNEHFSISLPHHLLLANTTIALIATQIEHFQQHGTFKERNTVLDLRREADLDNIEVINESLNVNPEKILITGATGYVGAYVLDTLLRQTSAQIVCLVRADSTTDAQKRLEDNLRKYYLWQEHYKIRLDICCGDFSEPYFLLQPQQYQQLCETIDTIYHIAQESILYYRMNR